MGRETLYNYTLLLYRKLVKIASLFLWKFLFLYNMYKPARGFS